MNSFAALIGSLTGAGAPGAAGMGASADSSDGLFAGLLEAGAATSLNGDAAGAGLKALLVAKDGASAPGTIDLTTLLQATTEAEGNPLATEIPVPGLFPAEAIALSGLTQPAPGETEAEGGAGEMIAGAALIAVPRQPAHAPDMAAGGASTPATRQADTGNAPATVPGQQAAPALPAEVPSRPAARDTAQDQQGAAGTEHAKRNTATAPGVNAAVPRPAATTTTQPAAAEPHAAGLAQAADKGKAAKAAHIAANTGAPGDISKRPAVLPADHDSGSRAELSRPVQSVRTIVLAPNGQTVVQLVKSDKSDASLAAGLDQTTATGAHMRVVAASQPGAQMPQVSLNGLAVHIAQQAANGARRFDIRLDPPELGRIEVRLDVSKDGKVSTHLVVERSETLDLLQRDARALERALQNAGLDTSDGNLKFSLKDHGGDQAHSGGGRQSHGGGERGGGEPNPAAPAEIDNATRTERRYLATGGLDIRI